MQQLQEEMHARALDNGELSQPFPVPIGVKQRYVLAPTLFSGVLSAVLTYASGKWDVGIDIKYCIHGKL